MGERHWTNPAPEAGDVIDTPGVTVRCLAPGGAALVSGDLDLALGALAPGAPMIGLLDPLPEEGGFALGIARDRALLCTPTPLDAIPGWHDGYAVSPADDLYVSVEIAGDKDGTFLGSCMSACAPSPSAMTLFADKACLVAHTGASVRVWVPRPDAAEVWTRFTVLSGA